MAQAYEIAEKMKYEFYHHDMADQMQPDLESDQLIAQEYGYEEEVFPREGDLKFTCDICADVFDMSNSYLLTNCEHFFHAECLQQYLRTEIEASKCPLICMD